jgi:nucleotide-binding universal stress UspA family protein
MRILLATDGSPDAEGALAFVAALPLPEGAAVRLVSVMSDPPVPLGPAGDVPPGSWQTWEQCCRAEQAQTSEALARAAAALQRDGVAVGSEVRPGQPAGEILAAAEEFDADLVVLGSKGRVGLERFLLGSVAENVARHCPRPVVIARAPRHDLQAVIVALDGSEHATHAAEYLAGFPLAVDTEVTAVSVAPPYHPPTVESGATGSRASAARELEQIRWDAAAALAEAARPRLETAGRKINAVVRMGDPADEILGLTRELEADLIVCGARGVSFLRGLISGSVADRLLRLLRSASCSVLLVR